MEIMFKIIGASNRGVQKIISAAMVLVGLYFFVYLSKDENLKYNIIVNINGWFPSQSLETTMFLYRGSLILLSTFISVTIIGLFSHWLLKVLKDIKR